MPHVAIIGGGFTGTAIATHLCAKVKSCLGITVVEPRDQLGGGLTYGGDDPDHRVNGTHELLILFPDDIEHFARWYDTSGAASRDPDEVARSGVRYVRRSEVRAYMQDALKDAQGRNGCGSSVTHLRDRAVGADQAEGRLQITLASGSTITPDLVVLALGGQKPAPSRGVTQDAACHPDYIDDPFGSEAISRVGGDEAVLLVGTGLTVADVLATLTRQGHQGPVTAISRRGLVLQLQREAPNVAALMTRLARPVPDFTGRHGENLSLAAGLKALSGDMATALRAGHDQKAAFDDMRDASSWLWLGFTEAKKRRFLRHLKPWYDIHRYRMVPQTGRIVAQMAASGQLTFRTARLVGLSVVDDCLRARLIDRGIGAVGLEFDRVINCTGPQSLARDPFITAICELGLARRGSLDLGLGVDAEGRVLDVGGGAQDRLWAFGLLTRGRFGDMTAIPQFEFRLHCSLPALAEAVTERKGISDTEVAR